MKQSQSSQIGVKSQISNGYILLSIFFDGQITICHLVGGVPTPLKNMNPSVGMMTFPTEWKVIKFHGSKPPTSPYFMVFDGLPSGKLLHNIT